MLTLTMALLAATPVLRTVATTETSCTLIQRQAPDWKPVTIFEAPQPCPAGRLSWSADSRRVLLDSVPPRLIDLNAKQLTTLPTPPKGSLGRLGFDLAGTIYALTESGEDGQHAWASRLDGGAWKVLESGKFEVTNWVSAADQLGTSSKLIKHRESRSTHLPATPAQIARLAAIPLAEGFEWKVASTGPNAFAYQMTGTDSCAFFAPIVVLTKARVVNVPFASWPADTCRNVSLVGGVLLISSATRDHRAELVDVTNGAVLATLALEETSPQLLEPKP